MNERERDRIEWCQGRQMGLLMLFANAGWDREEVIEELNKVYGVARPDRRYLVARFDVTELPEQQCSELVEEIARAAAESEPRLAKAGHPCVDLVIFYETAPGVEADVAP